METKPATKAEVAVRGLLDARPDPASISTPFAGSLNYTLPAISILCVLMLPIRKAFLLKVSLLAAKVQPFDKLPKWLYLGGCSESFRALGK